MYLAQRELPGGGLRFVERIKKSVDETHNKVQQQTNYEIEKIKLSHTATRLQRTVKSVLSQGEHEKYARNLYQTTLDEHTDRLSVELSERFEFLQIHNRKTEKILKTRNLVENLLQREIMDFNAQKKVVAEHIDTSLATLQQKKNHLAHATTHLNDETSKNRDLTSMLEGAKASTEEATQNKDQTTSDLSLIIDGRANGCFELEQNIKELEIQIEEVNQDLTQMRPIEKRTYFRDPLFDTIEEVVPELKWMLRRSVVLRAALISSNCKCLTEVYDRPDAPTNLQTAVTRVLRELVTELSERFHELETLTMKYSYTPDEWSSNNKHMIDVDFRNSSLSQETKRLNSQIKAAESDLKEYKARVNSLHDITEFEKIHLHTRLTYDEDSMYNRATSKVVSIQSANSVNHAIISNLERETKDLRENLRESLVDNSDLKKELVRLRRFVSAQSL
eukprot:TRINITY_DN19029_c0_g1_i1.p1 TRINITY_DN19029_c0_g1~~TRINITY_DN19029_c0_g1_i1.p1  ORF type:complete len:448 (+),score=61.98 TRINITY_DN19029_c0_g1_i1:91-1434(+)